LKKIVPEQKAVKILKAKINRKIEKNQLKVAREE
jgi:hypothetical protein